MMPSSMPLPAAAGGMPSGMPPMQAMPQDNYMAGPMDGFGPHLQPNEIRMPQPEYRHAPSHHRLENQELDEKDKWVNREEEFNLPSGTNKMMLYGALEDIRHAEMLEMREALKRRRRVNCIPVLLSLFLPWLLFLATFYMSSFYIKFVAPGNAILFNLIAVMISIGYVVDSFKKWRRNKQAGFYPFYMGVLFVVAAVLGWIMGDLNFWFRMQPCYSIEHLGTYSNVNPSQQTLKNGQVIPTRGKRYQDAGKVYFEANTKLDISKAMSFKMGDLYCVAPIVDANCEKNCGYDFWAVGLNCCSEDMADFRCGQYDNPAAKAGLRLMHDNLRPNFRLAVLEAEGVHEKVVSTHPLFFYWLHDPVKELNHLKHEGYKGFIIAMIASFLFLCVSTFFSVKWARMAFQ